MSLLPTSTEEDGPEEPQVVGFEDENIDEVVNALSSDTARDILRELGEDPAPASELAERVDTSLQNTKYHLNNLEAAGVVEVIDTAYSEKGQEMDIYAPSGQPIILISGSEEETSNLKAALTRLLGGLGVLAGASVLVQTAVPEPLPRQPPVEAAGGLATPPPPGLVFFAGGLLVLTVWVTVWYISYRD